MHRLIFLSIGAFFLVGCEKPICGSEDLQFESCVGEKVIQGGKLSGQFENGDLLVGTFKTEQFELSGEWSVVEKKDSSWPAVPKGLAAVRSAQGSLTYLGEYLSGRGPNGKGAEYNSDGSIAYTGEWNGGKRDGNGIASDRSGSRYEGEWKDNKRHGRGTLTHLDGDTYTGEFSGDVRQGKGAARFRDGRTYIGEFQNNLPNGEGTTSYPDGGKHVGQYRDGNLEGQGTRYLKDGGIVFQGEFKEGRFYRGAWHSRDGRIKHQGDYQTSLPHGFGRLLRTDGSVRYEGDYKVVDGGAPAVPDWVLYKAALPNYVPHGEGTFKTAAGGEIVGGWKDGLQHGQSKQTDEKGNLLFEGGYKDGIKHGFGTDGDREGRIRGEFLPWYRGNYKDGKYHGQGELYVEGTAYKGEFINGQQTGRGKFYRPDGTIAADGEWKDGYMHGQVTLYNEYGGIEYQGPMCMNQPRACY